MFACTTWVLVRIATSIQHVLGEDSKKVVAETFCKCKLFTECLCCVGFSAFISTGEVCACGLVTVVKWLELNEQKMKNTD